MKHKIEYVPTESALDLRDEINVIIKREFKRGWIVKDIQIERHHNGIYFGAFIVFELDKKAHNKRDKNAI